MHVDGASHCINAIWFNSIKPTDTRGRLLRHALGITCRIMVDVKAQGVTRVYFAPPVDLDNILQPSKCGVFFFSVSLVALHRIMR